MSSGRWNEPAIVYILDTPQMLLIVLSNNRIGSFMLPVSSNDLQRAAYTSDE
jgi:hypothetical protein